MHWNQCPGPCLALGKLSVLHWTLAKPHHISRLLLPLQRKESPTKPVTVQGKESCTKPASAQPTSRSSSVTSSVTHRHSNSVNVVLVESLNRKLREKEEELVNQLKELKTELKSHSTTISKLENKYDNDFRESYRVARVSIAPDKDDIRQDISMTASNARVESLSLDLSEGLFQIHMQKIEFDLEEEKLVNKKFQLQWTFYNHDTSFSPWFSKEQSNMEHSTLYKVNISSDFLEYLFNDECIVELCMESPEQTEIIAMGKLHFSGAIDSPYDKWKLTVPLQLFSNSQETIGILYCWYQMICTHKPVKGFIKNHCNLMRKVPSSQIAAEAHSEGLNKKNAEHPSCDEPSCATKGQKLGSILPEISSSSEGQSYQQKQSNLPSEEFKPEQAEKTYFPQQEENPVKSQEQSSSVIKTDASSDIKMMTSSYEKVLSDKLASQSHSGSSPLLHESSDQSILNFSEPLRSERPSGIASPISQRTIQSSLRKLVISTDTREKHHSTLPEQENICVSDSSKLSNKFPMKLIPEKERFSSDTTQDYGSSVCSVSIKDTTEEKDTEGSVRSIPVNCGKEFSSSIITPFKSGSKSPTEVTEDTPSDFAAKAMSDPTADSNSEESISNVFDESNWRNYSLRSLEIQKEIGKENSLPVSKEQQDFSLSWSSDESSSISTVEGLQTFDKAEIPHEDEEISKCGLVQISSSSSSDAEKDVETPGNSVKLLQAKTESCELPVKWEESSNTCIRQDSSKRVLILADGTKAASLPSDEDDDKDVEVEVRSKPSDDRVYTTASKGRRRLPHNYQDPEASRYQDLNDLMMRKQERKERRICCFNISSNHSETSPDSIEIVLHSLTLAHNTFFMRNSDVTQLYVEFSFLGYDGEEMETMSVPLNNDLHMNLNFRRTFYVDYGMHFKQRTILSNILTSEDKKHRNLRFIVVSEPPEEQDHMKECEEIGYADLDLVRIMTEGHELIKENIPVRTVDGIERLGFLTISMTGVKLMRKVAFETK